MENDNFENQTLTDKKLVCKECGRSFLFSVSEQKKFGQRGWPDPVRCRVCRHMKKILELALEENVPISAEVQFSEVCDKCGRRFLTSIKRKQGINLYCDDCWEEIKRGKINEEDRQKGQEVA